MGIESIDEELIKLRYSLVYNILKNIELKKDKFELTYHTKPKYVVVPYDTISLLRIYSDSVLYFTDSFTLLGMTIIESKACKDFTDVAVF